MVCDALVRLKKDELVLPEPHHCPPEIAANPKMFPYFKDCIGALDGTHIPCMPPKGQGKQFRNRKGFHSQNVLAACNFDLRFVYVLAGWEGSAADAGVLKDAIFRNGFNIPQGKYYLGDAGYGLSRSCLVPYRGVRYHLHEWALGNSRPQNSKELFNLRHAQLRNVIERIFGVMKKRFPILNKSMEYPMHRQVETCLVFILTNAQFFSRSKWCTRFAFCTISSPKWK